jgi:peptidoglycan/LPS O-acetylase OafA/YrhL
MLLGMVVGRGWLVALPGAALLLIVSAGADLRQEHSWMTRRWMVYLGELSFSFYLVHEVVLLTMVRGGHGGWWLTLSLPISVASAMALHHGVELPMHGRILRRARANNRMELSPRMRARRNPSSELVASEA